VARIVRGTPEKTKGDREENTREETERGARGAVVLVQTKYKRISVRRVRFDAPRRTYGPMDQSEGGEDADDHRENRI